MMWTQAEMSVYIVHAVLHTKRNHRSHHLRRVFSVPNGMYPRYYAEHLQNLRSVVCGCVCAYVQYVSKPRLLHDMNSLCTGDTTCIGSKWEPRVLDRLLTLHMPFWCACRGTESDNAERWMRAGM